MITLNGPELSELLAKNNIEPADGAKMLGIQREYIYQLFNRTDPIKVKYLEILQKKGFLRLDKTGSIIQQETPIQKDLSDDFLKKQKPESAQKLSYKNTHQLTPGMEHEETGLESKDYLKLLEDAKIRENRLFKIIDNQSNDIDEKNKQIKTLNELVEKKFNIKA